MKISCGFIFILLCSLVSCTGTDKDIRIVQEQSEYPVLKLKDYNNVLEINVLSPDSLTMRTIKEFVISTEGTTDLADIESVSVYYTGIKTSDINEKSVNLAGTSEVKPLIRLKTSYEIKGSENHFRLSYKLKENAGILNRFGGRCESVITDKGKAAVDTFESPKLLRTGVAVRKHNDDNVNTYRIPGLVTTNSGALLAVYDARRDSRRDLQGNIDIGISRSVDGGSTWEPMVIALDMGEWGGLPQKFNGVSDASLLVDKNTGSIFVAGLWMHGVLDDRGNWIKNLTDTSQAWNHQWRNRGSQPGFDVNQSSQFLIAKSNDDGKTWEPPVNITQMCKKKEWWLWAPAPGNGIIMDDGTLVFPTQGRDRNGEPFSNISYSKDGGLTWETSNPAYTNTTECAVVQLDDGSLMLNMRNNRNRNNDGPGNGRAIAVTTDMGVTWTEHPTSRNALIESVCMGSLYKHIYSEKDQKMSILLFSNPSTKKGRHHITIKASLDNGETWPEQYWLLLDEGSGNGYSCLTGVGNDHIGILYEGSQADMVFQKIPVRDIIDK